MNRPMGFILIIIGIVAIIGGVQLITRANHSNNQSSSNHVSAAKHNNATVETPTRKFPNFNAAPTPSKPDTIVVERIVERVVEKNEVKDSTKAVQTTDSKTKGNDFEDFVANLLADWRLQLLDRTQDHKSTAGVVAESSKNPDLHVKQKRGKGSIDYYIECKYRSRWHDGAVTFEDWQLSRYRKFQADKHRKVIIALGVGGTPYAPSTLRLVPIDSIKGSTIREIDTKYAIQPTSSALIDYMDSYFSDVFKNSKKSKSQQKSSEPK